MQGFLAAGHVCTVMGWTEYEPIAAQYRVPIVVTGFEPVDILEGMLMAVEQLEAGRYEVENQYVRSVRRDGTVPARNLVSQVFELVDRKWRGIGEIPRSGLGLRPEFADFDAELRFGLSDLAVEEPAECRAGDVLRGKLKPLRVPRLRDAVHARAPVRRTDGVVGGRLRGVLQLWAVAAGGR